MRKLFQKIGPNFNHREIMSLMARPILTALVGYASFINVYIYIHLRPFYQESVLPVCLRLQAFMVNCVTFCLGDFLPYLFLQCINGQVLSAFVITSSNFLTSSE